MKRVVLLVNGPGELWGWARPLCQELVRREWEITLQFLPCPFASGKEAEAVSSLGVKNVEPPRSIVSLAGSLGRDRADAVIQLGGDLLWGRLCAFRTGAPLGCYSYGPKQGMEHCQRIWTAFPFMARPMEAKGVRPSLIGDLVRDGLAMDDGPSPWSDGDGPRLALFPGSRPAIREKALDYLAALLSTLRRRVPSLEWVSLLSPFSDEEELSLWRQAGMNPTREGAGTVLPGATLALTQPGTNTLELMHCHTPGVVAVPFHFIRQVPLSGLKGMVAALPLIGGPMKEAYLRRLAKKTGFLSWPNRMAGSEVLWEKAGELPPAEASAVVCRCLEDREELRCRAVFLEGMSDAGGAASRLCMEIEEMVRQR